MNKKNSSKEIASNSYQSYFLPSLVLLCLLVYWGAMSSDLLNFDDNEYFELYPEVTLLSWQSVKMFFSNYYVLMYQPLPVLSFSLTHHFFGLQPFPHHFINLLLHILNIGLVYTLMGKLNKNNFIVNSVTFLFALHPLAVEAVMWLSCRSSGMYVAFYLLGLIAYLKYKEEKKLKYVIYCLLSFIFSLLSKANAVTFPLTLLVFDLYYFKEKLGWRLLLQKTPYFLLSLLFGIVTLQNTETAKNISYGASNYDAIDMLFLFSYEIIWYLSKTILPFDLSPIVVYPPKVDGILPWYCYVSLALLLIVGIAVFKFRKKQPIILLGLGIFISILSVTLQVIPSRLVIVADRYAYLPNIGIYYICSCLFIGFVKTTQLDSLKQKALKVLPFAIATLLVVFSFKQTKIWKNNLELANRIIGVNPPTDYIARAYGVRGNYKKQRLDATGAMADYEQALKLDSTDWIAAYGLGLIYKTSNDLTQAIYYLEKAGQNNTQTPLPYTEIGIIHLSISNYDLAMRYVDMALKSSPNYANALNLKAACFLNLNRAAEAELWFSKAIASNGQYSEAFKNRGIVRLKNLNNIAGACEDFKKAAELGEPGMESILKDYCN